MTINDYADALSDALNADLPDGEPAWSVVQHSRLRGVLVVGQLADPPRQALVWWRTGALGSEPHPGWTERSGPKPTYTGKRGARRLAADLLDPSNWSTT